MIDMLRASKAFKEYAEEYIPYDNGKIKLKIKHMEKVRNISRELATSLKLKKEDIDLAELIGLLHDIGRFEQAKQYNTFVDKDSIDHGKYGVKVLFEDGLIRKFVEDSKYDSIIEKAILNHNRGQIEENLNEREMLHAKIIRDADKTDIYRVLIEEDIQSAYCTDDMSEDVVQDEIVREFIYDHMIDYNLRQSAAESMISHFAYVFNFNYKMGLEKVKQNDYINRLANKYEFKNKDTYEKVQKCAKIANEYVEEALRKG